VISPKVEPLLPSGININLYNWGDFLPQSITRRVFDEQENLGFCVSLLFCGGFNNVGPG
jgi:hypothetical protein